MATPLSKASGKGKPGVRCGYVMQSSHVTQHVANFSTFFFLPLGHKVSFTAMRWLKFSLFFGSGPKKKKKAVFFEDDKLRIRVRRD